MLKPNSEVTTNLIKARELIADKKNWCQQAMYGSDGSLCALGALARVGVNLLLIGPELTALEKAGGELFGEPFIASVNDRRGHTAVMRVFDKAIELSLSE